MTPYEILGLPETASKAEAERAWKKAVRSLHPDRHPEADRDGLTQQLSKVNQAWASIQKGSVPQTSNTDDPLDARFKRTQEIPLTYSARDPNLRGFLDTMLNADLSATKLRFWTRLIPALLTFSLPKRDPIQVALCAGVVIENNVLSYLFHSPLPKGRVAMVVPKVRKTAMGINVLPNQPESIMIEPASVMTGVYSPFDADKATALGLSDITVVLPTRVLDITKIFPLKPTGAAQFYYK